MRRQSTMQRLSSWGDWEIIFKPNMLAVFLVAFQLACAQQTTPGPQVLVAHLNADISLPCMPLDFSAHATYNLSLIKGKDSKTVVCSGYWSPNSTILSPSPDLMPCFTNGTSFQLSKLGIQHRDYYTCHRETFHPPPYGKKRSSEIYLHVLDKELPAKELPDKEVPKCESVPLLLYWLLIGIGGALLVCPIGIIALYLYKRPRKGAPALPEPNSEYMPMAAVAAAKNNRNEKRVDIPERRPESMDYNYIGVSGTHIYNKVHAPA